MTNVEQYAADCIPDLTVALSGGETIEEIVDAMITQFPPSEDNLDEEACRRALAQRLSSATKD